MSDILILIVIVVCITTPRPLAEPDISIRVCPIYW
jgi:hypothetical protein